jgi:hypothetical protein
MEPRRFTITITGTVTTTGISIGIAAMDELSMAAHVQVEDPADGVDAITADVTTTWEWADA